MKKYYSDVRIVCRDCGQEFVWTGGEQSFVQRLIDEGKKWRSGEEIVFAEPKRCPGCRAKKKEKFNQK
jgi:hypothetical protein